MNDTIAQLTPLFEKVSEKIGQGAMFSWEVILKQQITYGIIFTILAVISLAGVIIMSKLYKNSPKSYGSGGEPFFFFIIVFSVCCLGFMIGAILYLFNPEYFALNYFLNLVK